MISIGFDLLGALAVGAHAARDRQALLDRFRQRDALPRGVAHLRAKRLVGLVVGAQRIAVHEQRGRAVEVDRRGIGDEVGAGRAREALRHEEIAVAVHEAHRHARARARRGACDATGKGSASESSPTQYSKRSPRM